jgi:hypothetical protein
MALGPWLESDLARRRLLQQEYFQPSGSQIVRAERISRDFSLTSSHRTQ